VLLLALVVSRWRSVIHTVRAARHDGYALLLVVYVLLFVFFFSSIGNFGILARQRASQLFPFLFMLIALRGPDTDRSDRAGAEGVG
jgi:hypothetical protein